MNWFPLILLPILANICITDIRTFKVSLILILAGIALSIVMLFVLTGMQTALSYLLLNFVFLTILLGMIWLVILILKKNLTDSFGLGDVLFLIMAAFNFSPLNYVVFVMVSAFVAIVLYLLKPLVRQGGFVSSFDCAQDDIAQPDITWETNILEGTDTKTEEFAKAIICENTTSETVILPLCHPERRRRAFKLFFINIFLPWEKMGFDSAQPDIAGEPDSIKRTASPRVIPLAGYMAGILSVLILIDIFTPYSSYNDQTILRLLNSL